MSHTLKRVNDRDWPELIPRLNKMSQLNLWKLIWPWIEKKYKFVGPITVPCPVLNLTTWLGQLIQLIEYSKSTVTNSVIIFKVGLSCDYQSKMASYVGHIERYTGCLGKMSVLGLKALTSTFFVFEGWKPEDNFVNVHRSLVFGTYYNASIWNVR